MAFSSVDLEHLVHPVGEHCSALLDTFAAAVTCGDNHAAAVAAVELGRIIGATTARMYAYERLLEDVAEGDPAMRAVLGELIRAAPLPASVPTTFTDEI